MKIAPLILTVSLAVNAALAALFFAGSAGAPKPGRAGSGARPATAPAKVDASAASLDADTWTKLQGDDPSSSMEKLRAAGFPPAMTRALAAELVRLQFAPRRVALDLKASEAPFWMNGSRDPKVDAQLREIMKEQEKATKDLLGSDPANAESYVASLRRQFPQFSEEKLDELQRIQQQFNERRAEHYASVTGPTTSPEDRAKLTALDKAQRDDIARALTPTEFEDYELRTSNVATSLRSQLVAFDTTEQEFRALFQIRRTFEDRFGPMYAPPSQEEIRQRAEAQKNQDEQIKAALGEQRYAEYQRAADSSYRQTTLLVGRLGLPAETAGQVYALQKDYQQRIPSVLGNRQLSPDERNDQLRTFAADVETKLTAALGARGYEAYKQNGGQWVQSLQSLQRVAPPPRN